MTEFACTQMELFLTGCYTKTGTRTKGATTTSHLIADNFQEFTVFIFNEKIFSLSMMNWKPISISVSFTNFFDRNGHPTGVTRERLNGLLDRLGSYRIIPSGVRVFKDDSCDLCYIGKGDNKIAIGQKYMNLVMIRPGAQNLDFV